MIRNAKSEKKYGTVTRLAEEYSLALRERSVHRIHESRAYESIAQKHLSTLTIETQHSARNSPGSVVLHPCPPPDGGPTVITSVTPPAVTPVASPIENTTCCFSDNANCVEKSPDWSLSFHALIGMLIFRIVPFGYTVQRTTRISVAVRRSRGKDAHWDD